jgi:hypothetical protein
MRANVLQEILIDGQAAGPGSPSVDITDIHGKLFLFSTRSSNEEVDKENEKNKRQTITLCISLTIFIVQCVSKKFQYLRTS